MASMRKRKFGMLGAAMLAGAVGAETPQTRLDTINTNYQTREPR